MSPDSFLSFAYVTNSQETKDIAQDLCCGDANSDDGGFQPSSPPVYDGPVGDEPDCPICGTMEYPGIPNAFVVARYVGEYTCAQLYGRGLNGMTPSFMCGPLQDFAEPVCGCGEYNPKCRDDPNQCWEAPGNSPVSSPVQQPVEQPVQPPIQQPVASPVLVEPTTSFDRKTPPEGGKYSTKLANGRGGAASVLRGGRRAEESDFVVGDTDLPEMPQDLEFDFRVVEKEDLDAPN